MPIIKKMNSVEQYEKLIETYRIQNPVKFAQKEKVLMERLAALRGEVKVEVKEEVPEKLKANKK